MSKLGDRIKIFRTSLNIQQGEFAKKLGLVQQQLSKYEKGDNEPSSKFFTKLCENTDINLNWLLTGEGEMLRSGASINAPKGCYFIPYYDGISAEKLVKHSIRDGFPISKEIIIKEWNCNPENVRLISTPGEEMDGGQYPIRNNDLLVIDISKTDISDSGIYLITTNNGKIVALRRLMELLDGSVRFYVDNDTYASAVNTTASPEQLKEMDFKVIGRVVKNITYAF